MRVFAQLIGVALRFLAKAFEQQTAEMFRGQNLRTVGVNVSIAHPNFVDAVHQFGNEIEPKTGGAEGRDLVLGREDHLRVFNCVLEIVFLHLLGTG